MAGPNTTEATIEFKFEIDDNPIKHLNDIMNDFRENQLKSNEKLVKALEKMNKQGIKNTIIGYKNVRKELRNHLKQQRTEHKKHGEWLKGITDKYKTNVQTVNKKLTTDVKNNAKKQATAVKNAYKDIEVNVQKALAGVAKSFSKNTKAVSKEAKKLGQDFSKISGMFKLDIETSELDKPINDMRSMMANLKAVGVKGSADFNAAITRGYRMMSSNSAEEIKEGQKIIENTLKRNYTNQLRMLRENTGKQMNLILKSKKEQLEAHKATLKRLLQNDRLSDAKRLEIEKSFNAKMKAIRSTANRQVISLNQRRNNTELKMAQRHSKRMSMVQRTGARQQQVMPGRRVTGFLQNTPIFGEMASAAQGLTARLGPLGSVLGKLGPIGMVVAGVLGTTALLFAKSAKAAGLYHDSLARIGTLLTDKQMNLLPAAMDKVRATALSTGKAIDNLATTFYNVISAVPSLGNNLNAVASIVDKAAKTATALGAETDEIALAMTNLGNAAGLSLEDIKNQDMILDVLANTMKQGVIPSASILASNIAKNAPLFSALNANIEDTVNVLGAATALFTASGVSMEETQTQMKAFAQELIDVNKQAKLVQAGIEGINPEGQVEDWNKLTDSIVANMDEVMQIFTSSEAKNAVRILAKEGGNAFKDLILSMENAGGTSDAMFARMANTSKMASDRMGVAWNNLMISMGSGSSSMVTGFKNGVTSMINSVNSLFETSEQAMNAAMDSANQYIDLSSGIEGVNALIEDALENLGDKHKTKEAFAAIRHEANEIQKTMPGMALNINAILEGKGEAPEKMRQLAIEMANVQKIADLLSQVQLGKAIKEGAESIEDAAGNLDYLNDVAVHLQKSQGRSIANIERMTELLNKRNLSEVEYFELIKMEDTQFTRRIKTQDKYGKSLFDQQKIVELSAEKRERLNKKLIENMDQMGVLQLRSIEQDAIIADAKALAIKQVQDLYAGLKKAKGANGELLSQEKILNRLKLITNNAGKGSLVLQKEINNTVDELVVKHQEEVLIKTQLKGITEETINANIAALNVENKKIVVLLREKGLLSQVLGTKAGLLIADMALLEAQGKLTDETRRQLVSQIELLNAKYRQSKADEKGLANIKAANIELKKSKTGTDTVSRGATGRTRTPATRKAEKEQQFNAKQMADAITQRVNAEKQAWEQAQKDKKAIIQAENDQKKKELQRHAKFMEESKKRFQEELKLIGERLEAERKFNKHLRDIAKGFQQQAISIAKSGAKEAKGIARALTADTSIATQIKERRELRAEKAREFKEEQEGILANAKLQKEMTQKAFEEKKLELEKSIQQEIDFLENKAGLVHQFDIMEAKEAARQTIDIAKKAIEAITIKNLSEITKLNKEIAQLDISTNMTLMLSEISKEVLSLIDDLKLGGEGFKKLGETMRGSLGENTKNEIIAWFDVMQEELSGLNELMFGPASKVNPMLDKITALKEAIVLMGKDSGKALAGSFFDLITNPPPEMDSAGKVMISLREEVKALRPELEKAPEALLRMIDVIMESGGTAAEILEKLKRSFDPAFWNNLIVPLEGYEKQLGKVEDKVKELSEVVKPILQPTFGEMGLRMDFGDSLKEAKFFNDMIEAGVPVIEEFRIAWEKSNRAIKDINKEIEGIISGQTKSVEILDAQDIIEQSINDKSKDYKELYDDRIKKMIEELEARKIMLDLMRAELVMEGKLTPAQEVAIQVELRNIAKDISKLKSADFKTAQDNYKKEQETTKEEKDQEKTGKEKLDDAVKFMKSMESIADLAIEIGSSMDEIQNMFRRGEGGAATEKMGDLTKKVGEALLNSSIPQLQVAGAVLLGIGIITKVAGKIASLFIKPEETRAQQADKYIAAQEKLLAIYDAQRQKLDNLQDLGDRSLDTAAERLKAEQQILETQLAQQGITADNINDIVEEVKKLNEQGPKLKAWLVDAGVALEQGLGSDAYHDLLRELFGEGKMFAGQWEKIFGEDLGKDLEKYISSGDFEDAMSAIEAAMDKMGMDAETKQELINTFNIIKGLIEDARKEFEALMGLRVDLIVDLGLTNAEIVQAAENVSDMYRDELNKSLAEIAPDIDWAALSPDELKAEVQKILAGLSDEEQELFGADILEFFNQWIGALDNVEDSLDGLLKSQMGLNTARTKIDPMDDEFLSEGDALDRNLALVRKMLETVDETTVSYEYILDLKAQEYALEQDILNLGKEGNDVLSEKIRLLHIQRQEAIARVREGTATAADIALIGKTEAEIIAEMKAGGATPEEIEATEQSFAASSHQEGTDYIPKNELAYLHEGEAVLTKADNVKLGKMLSMLQQSIAMPQQYMRGILDNYTASRPENKPIPIDYFGDSGKMGDTVINLNINISGNVDNPEEVAGIIYAEFSSLHAKEHQKSGSWNSR